MNQYFSYDDLTKILEIKDRLIHTLLVGGGGALSEYEELILNHLINKAKTYLEEK